MQGVHGRPVIIRAPFSVCHAAAQQEFYRHGLWKFWSTSPSAVCPIIGIEQRLGRGIQFRFARDGSRCSLRGRGMGQQPDHLCADTIDLVPLLVPGVRKAVQQVFEGRQVVAWNGWKIRAGEERAQVGGKENGHGPAAGSGHGRGRRHVDAVQVGSFLPIDLDANEILVHDGGRRGVLE